MRLQTPPTEGLVHDKRVPQPIRDLDGCLTRRSVPKRESVSSLPTKYHTKPISSRLDCMMERMKEMNTTPVIRASIRPSKGGWEDSYSSEPSSRSSSSSGSLKKNDISELMKAHKARFQGSAPIVIPQCSASPTVEAQQLTPEPTPLLQSVNVPEECFDVCDTTTEKTSSFSQLPTPRSSISESTRSSSSSSEVSSEEDLPLPLPSAASPSPSRGQSYDITTYGLLFISFVVLFVTAPTIYNFGQYVTKMYQTQHGWVLGTGLAAWQRGSGSVNSINCGLFSIAWLKATTAAAPSVLYVGILTVWFPVPDALVSPVPLLFLGLSLLSHTNGLDYLFGTQTVNRRILDVTLHSWTGHDLVRTLIDFVSFSIVCPVAISILRGRITLVIILTFVGIVCYLSRFLQGSSDKRFISGGTSSVMFLLALVAASPRRHDVLTVAGMTFNPFQLAGIHVAVHLIRGVHVDFNQLLVATLLGLSLGLGVLSR